MNSRLIKFLSYYKPYLGTLCADIVFAFIIALTTLLLPLCAGHITRNILAENSTEATQQIYLMAALMLGLLIVQTIANAYVAYQGHMMGTRMECDMRDELFDHYQKLPFSFYDQQKTGQLMTRLTNDLNAISELAHHGPEDILISIVKFIGVFAILLTINVKLTLILFVVLPVMAFHAFYFNKKMRVMYRKSRDRIGDINMQIEDTLNGIRVVKSFTNEYIEKVKFRSANDRFLDSRRNAFRAETIFFEGLMAWIELLTIMVIIFGGLAIVSASLDLAELVMYLLCLGVMVEPIRRGVNFARLYQEGIAGFNRFMEMLEIQPEIADISEAIELGTIAGNISFRNISFKYVENDLPVFENLSLDIRAGEYVALVGTSGVGKTTLCSLIPRFYEVNSGTIFVDGYDIRDVSQQSLRQNIGVVLQDVYLFAGTVAENIRYGKPDASRAEIIQAARRANAHEFIMTLPHGYDTDIGQRGVKLSGGQKQRLSIARVFLKNPPILIFDEATSSLDNESERLVQESLETLTHSRTTIVIAHRLSTVRNAERIIVLTEKGIHEEGSHDDLILEDGHYARLYNTQLIF